MKEAPNNLSPQGMKNFYWHVFENTGSINDYIKYSVSKEQAIESQAQENGYTIS